ncbi:hypothetical protein GGI08_006351 [Coemansia sp. S2]|nr:hypothetical protein GGI08_006351 [Coemansia sp. S2]
MKGLPVLAKLTCGIYGLDSELEFIPNEELPDHIATEYENVGKCLKIWNPMYYSKPNDCETAEYITLLALACPKLGRIMVDPSNAPELNASIADVLQRDAYSKYAERLAHLHNIAY